MQTEKIEAFLEGIEGWSWEKIGLWAILFFFSGLAIVLTYQGKLPLDIDHFAFLFFLLLLFALYRPRLSFFALVFFLPFEIINLAPAELGLALRPYQLLTVTTLLAIVLRIIGGKMNPRKIHFIGLDAFGCTRRIGTPHSFETVVDTAFLFDALYSSAYFFEERQGKRGSTMFFLWRGLSGHFLNLLAEYSG